MKTIIDLYLYGIAEDSVFIQHFRFVLFLFCI